MIEKVLLAFSDDGVATVTLNNPPLNIYDLEMRDGLIEAITAVRDHPDARVLVLQTEAKHFSAGADLLNLVQRNQYFMLVEFAGIAILGFRSSPYLYRLLRF